MVMLKISLPDGLLHEYASGITVGEIVRNAYGKKSGAVAALVNGEERDFSYALEQDCDIEPILGKLGLEGTFFDTPALISWLKQWWRFIPRPNPLLDLRLKMDFIMTSRWTLLETKISRKSRKRCMNMSELTTH